MRATCLTLLWLVSCGKSSSAHNLTTFSQEVSARVIAEDLALPTAPANPQSYLLQTYGHYFANALFRTITAPQDNSILGNPLEDLMEL